MHSRKNLPDLEKRNLGNRLAILLLDHLADLDEDVLNRLICFCDYELRERDEAWEELFKQENPDLGGC